MINVTIKVYDYGSQESFTVFASGYLYTSGPAWTSTSVQVLANTPPSGNYRVRFCRNSDSSEFYILIGQTNSEWSYPHVAVMDVTVGYNNVSALYWGSGWSMDVVTSVPPNVDGDYIDSRAVVKDAGTARFNAFGGNVIKRRGGSSTDWTDPGLQTFTPGDCRIETGAINITLSGGYGAVSISFSSSFAYPPLVFASVIEQYTSVDGYWAIPRSITESRFNLGARSDSGSDTTVAVAWMAIGPK
jgi:hypothetical protein